MKKRKKERERERVLHGLVKQTPVSLPTYPKWGGNRANGPFGERTTRSSCSLPRLKSTSPDIRPVSRAPNIYRQASPFSSQRFIKHLWRILLGRRLSIVPPFPFASCYIINGYSDIHVNSKKFHLLISCVGMTCHARQKFFVPKLQYFLNFKYIQV